MELHEPGKPFFSKWVDKEEKIPQIPSKNYSENEIETVIKTMPPHPRKLDSKLKGLVRYGMQPKFRALLWSVASGGAEKHRNNPLYYHEIIDDLGIQIPNHLPNNMFNNQQSNAFYLLSQEGIHECLKILYVLSQMHPDIHFCPLLPPLTSLALHFMDKEEVFCCMSMMLDSSHPYFDQSQTAVAVTAKTFQDCLKVFMKKSYKQLKALVGISRDITQFNKGTVFFPLWISWIFSHLDFWTLVYVVDNFLIQGPKVLVRVGLVLFSQFEKWINKNEVVTDEDIELKFSQFLAESHYPKGYKLMEAAFKIRGLSRKKLASIRARNMVLLNEGILEVPFSFEKMRISTLHKVEGTDMLNNEQWEMLSSWLPEKVQIKHPFCLFSTQEHGFSIQTLYKQCENEMESMLLVKTSKGEILGAFCATPWNERQCGSKTLSFFGTGETFVFSLNPNNCKMYSWNGRKDTGQELNDFFMAGDKTCLIIGGGGDNALWIDGELLYGHSGKSKTFNNEPLASERDFEIVRVEVLGFKS